MDVENLDTVMGAYAQGDELAFSTLYDGLSRPVRQQLRRFVHDEDQVEDLRQETFLRAHAARHHFAQHVEDGVRRWYLTIARNVAFDHLGRKYREQKRRVRACEVWLSEDFNTEDAWISQDLDAEAMYIALEGYEQRLSERGSATVSRAIDAIEQAMESAALAEKTVRNYRQGLAHVRRAIGRVAIRDLTEEHAQAMWEALPAASIWSYAGGIKRCLRWAEELGFVGLADFVSMLPQHKRGQRRETTTSLGWATARVRLDVRDIALIALEWAREHTSTSPAVLDLLEFTLHVRAPQAALADLRVADVNLYGGYLNLGGSRVELEAAAAAILRRQIERLPQGSVRAWPGRNGWHIEPDICRRAWSRIRRAYAATHTDSADARLLLQVQWRDLQPEVEP